MVGSRAVTECVPRRSDGRSKPCPYKLKRLAEAGPVVSDNDRIGRIGGVVLDAGGLTGDEAFEFDLAFEAGDILRGVIGDTGNCVTVRDEMARASVYDNLSARTEQTLWRGGFFRRVLDEIDDLPFGDAADLIEVETTFALDIFR